MTDLDVLKEVIADLDMINVPIWLAEQITIPVANANNKLKNLYEAIKAKNDNQQSNEDKIKFLGVETISKEEHENSMKQ